MVKKDTKGNLKMIPTVGAFYNNKVDDRIYTHLLCLSSGDSNKETVVFKGDMPTNKKTAETLGITRRKVELSIKNLEELELIKYNENKEIVIIRQANFKLVPLNLLCYLSKLPKNTVKIFTYLLNKYEWMDKNGRKYNFTIKELIEATGRVATRKKEVYEEIKNILELLQKSNIIDIDKQLFKAENSKIGQTEKFVLNNVSFLYKEVEEYKTETYTPTEEDRKLVEEYYNAKPKVINVKQNRKVDYRYFYYNTGLDRKTYDQLSNEEAKELADKGRTEREERKRLEKEQRNKPIDITKLFDDDNSNNEKALDMSFIDKFKMNKKENTLIYGTF